MRSTFCLALSRPIYETCLQTAQSLLQTSSARSLISALAQINSLLNSSRKLERNSRTCSHRVCIKPFADKLQVEHWPRLDRLDFMRGYDLNDFIIRAMLNA